MTSVNILDLPHAAPFISGVNSKYLLGDRLVADCLLPESHPPAILQWYINDITADVKHISRQYTITRNISQYKL